MSDLQKLKLCLSFKIKPLIHKFRIKTIALVFSNGYFHSQSNYLSDNFSKNHLKNDMINNIKKYYQHKKNINKNLLYKNSFNIDESQN